MLRYTVGSHKGNLTNGVPDNYSRYDETTGRADTFNDPWSLGVQGKQRVEYTSAKVTKTGVVVSANNTTVELKWTPILPGSIMIKKFTGADVTAWIVDEATVAASGHAAVDGEGQPVQVSATGHGLFSSNAAPSIEEVVTKQGCVAVSVTFPNGAVITQLSGSVKYGTTRDDRFNSANAPGSVVLDAGTYDISYMYDNSYIPANDVPLMNAEMDAIPLTAKPRRIAVYYSKRTVA